MSPIPAMAPSLISTLNNSKIGNPIKVGREPYSIGVDSQGLKVYVANSGVDSVSVIKLSNTDYNMGTIHVGGLPDAIGFDSGTGEVYVANSDDNTVSVINSLCYTKIGNLSVPVFCTLNNSTIGSIKVGSGPSAIGIDSDNRKVYVANYRDDSVSVIDEATDNVIAAVKLSVNPFNAGHIECGKTRLIAPVAQPFYISSGSECTARPNPGFDFVSWQENLGGNSSRVIQFASPPPFYEPILDILNLTPDRPEAALNVTKFGSFTANFKATPPPIPPEYVATLITVVITTLVGSLLIPAIYGRLKSKRQTSRLNSFRRNIHLHGGGNIDQLNTSLNEIINAYSEGKISNEQYSNLKNEISILHKDIYKKRIQSAKGNGTLLDELKEDVEDAYANEKISEKHYKLLIEKITDNKINQESADQLSSSQESRPTTQGSPIKS